jgi:peptide/nickel transport system permease protein
MRAYILRRLAIFPVFLLTISIAMFLVIRALPGDAALVNLGLYNAGCDSCVAAARADLGLDKSIPEQYWLWATNAIHGDFGKSTVNRTEIAPEVRSRFWNTFQIITAAMALTLLVGIPLGAFAAVARNRVSGAASRVIAIIGLSVPNFWLGTLVVSLPAIWWGWTPATNWVGWSDPWEHVQLVIVPALIIAVTTASYVARIVRASIVDSLGSDYVRTAYAKGLSSRVVVHRHVLRNSMLTVLTVLGLQAGSLLGGAVVVETIFSVPGLGLMASQAVVARDYQALQLLTVLFAGWFITVQLLVDVAYAAVDPRIRY